MKTMKEITKMSAEDRAAFVEKKRNEIREHRFGTGGRNVSAVRTAKKEIARALTVSTTQPKEATK